MRKPYYRLLRRGNGNRNHPAVSYSSQQPNPFLADGVNVKASLPPVAALVLVGLSVVLTLLGNLILPRKAAKSDPVTALEQIKKQMIVL